jgi:hypothetical protein
MSVANLKAGMSRAEIEACLGKPSEVKPLQNSFRPRSANEDPADYHKELKDWEQKTPGEIWVYETPPLSLSLSKAGKLLSWSQQ